MPGGVNVGTAFVEIRPQVDRFGQQLSSGVNGQAQGAGTTAGNRFGAGMTRAVGGLGRAVGGLVAGGLLVNFLSDTVAEAQEAATTLAATRAVIQSTGGVANVTAGGLETLAGRLSDLAAVDDELIASAGNVLLTFTDIRNVGEDRIFDEALASALDMSVALDQDLQGSVIQIGKALNDPIGALSSLTRAGVQFTDQQKDQIETMVESGDTVGAQRVILEELEEQFGGSAEAGVTASGRWTTAMDNLKEAIGERILPALTDLADGASDLMESFEALDQPTQDLIIGLGGVAVAAGVAWIAIGGIPAVIIGTILGLVFAVMYLKDNLWAVQEAARGAATTFSGAFPQAALAVQWVSRQLGEAWGLAVKLAGVQMTMITTSVSALGKWLGSVLGTAKLVWGAIKSVAGLVVGSLGFNGLRDAISGALGPAGTLLDRLRQISQISVPGIGGLIPGRASGGPVSGGGATLVGERGPELLFGSYGQYMTSAHQSEQLVAAGGGVVAGDLAGEIAYANRNALAGMRIEFDSRGAYLAISSGGRGYERGSRGLRGSGL